MTFSRNGTIPGLIKREIFTIPGFISNLRFISNAGTGYASLPLMPVLAMPLCLSVSNAGSGLCLSVSNAGSGLFTSLSLMPV